MIDAVRDLFDMDDPGDPDAAAEAARDEVLTEIPRPLLDAVAEGVVERVLRRARDDGSQDLAEIYVDAVADYYDPGRSGSRDERKRRRERETVHTIRAAFDDRLAELDAEREAAERREGWAWEAVAPSGAPQEAAIRAALERVHDRLQDAGEAGMTAEGLHEAFRAAYRGNNATAVTSAKRFWTRWAAALADAPGVEHGGGAWRAAPADMVAEPRTVEIDGRPLGAYDDGDMVARMYEALGDGARTDWDLADAAAPQGRSPSAETAAALRSEPVVAGRTAFDAVATLPGVEPPDEDAPLLRVVDDSEDGGES